MVYRGKCGHDHGSFEEEQAACFSAVVDATIDLRDSHRPQMLSTCLIALGISMWGRMVGTRDCVGVLVAASLLAGEFIVHLDENAKEPS